uniref:Pre-mRNA splicing Prp18-interacting factor n=1 Tax=Tanacetum cinerariifolium TaxID=118510 RepID=A0A6L2M714_TANCI|nr:hypothetical protein [Tanacetum cinerariifolium]
MAQQSCSYCGGPFNGRNFPSCSIVGARNEFVHDPSPFSYDNTPEFYDQPPQHHVETYSCELCGNDSYYGYDCPPRFLLCQPRNQNFYEPNLCYNSHSFGFDQPPQYSIDHQPWSIQEDLNQQRMNDECIKSHNDMIESKNELLNTMKSLCEMILQREQAANLSNHTLEPSRRFNSIFYDDDDDEESTIPLNEIVSQIHLSIEIILVLPTMEPEDSLIMGDEDLRTIPKKESDEFIKSSVKDIVPIPRESNDTFDSDKECDLPFCDNYVIFSNPLFDANDVFTSSNEGVQEKKFKIYSNSLFEFGDKYISSDVNPLFNEVLEDIENKDSYVSNLNEPAFLVTPLSDANEDECFDPGGDTDEIDAFLDIHVSTNIKDGYHDSEGDITYLESLLINDTIPSLPPGVFLDHDPRSLKDEPDNDDLKSMVKVFDLEIREKNYFFNICEVNL